MRLTYRQLLPEDLSLLQQLGRDTYEPYYPHIWKPGGLDWNMEHCFGNDILSKELTDPNLEYWLPIDESGRPVGLLKLLLQKPVYHYPIDNALYLEKIYLLPDFFGQGAGQVLMDFVKQRARELDRAAVWLLVMKSGPVKAYERAGFESVGEVYWDFELLQEAERGGWVMLYPFDPE